MTDMPRSDWSIEYSSETTWPNVGEASPRVGEECVDGSFGVSVVEVVELLLPGGVALGVRRADLVEIAQRVNDVIGRGENRPGSVVEAEVGATQLTGITVEGLARRRSTASRSRCSRTSRRNSR